MKIDIKRIIIFLIIVLVFRLVYKIYVYNYKYGEWKSKNITVDICSIEKIEEKNVYKVKYNNDLFLLNMDNETKIFKPGDRITVLSNLYKIKKYNNPYEFDYKRYLNSKNIVSVLYCNKVIREESSTNKMIIHINYLRNIISNKLDTNLSYIESNFIKSFVYGDDIYIDKELKEKFIDIGLGHILCVSGTHVSFLLLAFEKITKSRKRNLVNIILLIYFYIISLFKISLFRPICMYILSFVNKKMSFIARLFISFILVLIINPYYIFNIGVIFSFLSILSIKFFYSLISSWFNIKINKKHKKIIYFIISNISLTLSSQILILPFQIYFFQKISLISILSNIVICFTLNIFMYCIFILFILFFIPIISDFILHICSNLLYLILIQVEVIYKINYFSVTLPKPNVLVFISFYLVILILLYKKLIIVYFWKYRKQFNAIVTTLNYICIGYIFYWYINTMYFEKYVIYFNVGQGNMALLHFKTTNIVVDIGSTKNNVAGNILTTFLKAKNIKNIDLVLFTHMHSDHINGLEGLVKDTNIQIKRVCYTKPYKEIEEYTNLKYILKRNNIGIIEVVEEDNIKINKVEIDILSPPKKYYIKDADMLNANSTVYLISQNLNNYLFMGDSTKNTEKYILNSYIKNNKDIKVKNKLKNINVYQVSHHGSKTSSYEGFIKEMSAKNAIFSAQKSVYGHPSEEVIEIFKNYNYIIYLTEKNGAIKF